MRARLGLIITLAACGGTHVDVDADLPGPFTLTVVHALVDTEIAGNGIACGSDPMACAGSGQQTRCSVTLAKGTHISLTLTHPVCGTTGEYLGFMWSPPCPIASQLACNFDLTSDTTLQIIGAGD